MHSDQTPHNVLVIGAAGMLGNAVFRFFADDPGYRAFGTIRSAGQRAHFAPGLHENLLSGIDVASDSDLMAAFAVARPATVINCVGVIKQADAVRNHLTTLALNALFPHRLVQIAHLSGSRVVHLSTDCVFSGAKGGYTEDDFADAGDLYGRSKFLGEIDYPNAVTLRTSIIGHELDSNRSLIDWFLSQPGPVKGFRKAVFSGLPTVEIARVIRDHVIANRDLSGLYHLSAAPIDKCTLLGLVNETYGQGTEIIPDDRLVIDRSLNSDRFRAATGFTPLPWPDLIARMYQDYLRHRPADQAG